MSRPNLFNFATSELSQDAFIAWLLTWANKEYENTDRNLHTCATDFVRQLIGVDICDITTVKVIQQWNHIDVAAIVNNEYFIVIEDKTGTSEHSNQLEKYAEIAKQHHSDKKIVLVYFKMEEQSDLSTVYAADYSVFTREKMLLLLDSQKFITNNILLDYHYHLKRLDEQINSFKTLEIDKWNNSYCWQGFFSALQKELGGNWGYVPNAAGGFWGFWWHWNSSKLDDNAFRFYLQLEYDKMIFKISIKQPEQRAKIRDFYRKHLSKIAKEQGIKIEQYGRTGKCMGVAKLVGDYRIGSTDKKIDLNSTIENLKKMEQLINSVTEQL